MSKMDWFEEFIDYKLSQSESNEIPAEASGCLPFILCALAVLWIIAKIFY